MNMKPAIQFQLRDYRTSGFILFLVNAILVSLVPLGLFSINVDDQFSYSAYGFSAAIYMLVCGIVFARQVIRLCAQMGTGRKTAFRSLFPSVILAALVIALAGEILMVTAQTLWGSVTNAYFNDLYGLIYHGFEQELTLPQHGVSVLFSTCLMLACYGFGLFCTTLFWRLNKIGCVIAGILLGTTLLFGVPFLSLQFVTQMDLLLAFCLASPWNCMGVFLVIFLFFSIIAWFLVRNVHIRAGAK